MQSIRESVLGGDELCEAVLAETALGSWKETRAIARESQNRDRSHNASMECDDLSNLSFRSGGPHDTGRLLALFDEAIDWLALGQTGQWGDQHASLIWTPSPASTSRCRRRPARRRASRPCSRGPDPRASRTIAWVL
jgi:hypothetical protein